jgi:hypothetical protein
MKMENSGLIGEEPVAPVSTNATNEALQYRIRIRLVQGQAIPGYSRSSQGESR